MTLSPSHSAPKAQSFKTRPLTALQHRFCWGISDYGSIKCDY